MNTIYWHMNATEGVQICTRVQIVHMYTALRRGSRLKKTGIKQKRLHMYMLHYQGAKI